METNEANISRPDLFVHSVFNKGVHSLMQALTVAGVHDQAPELAQP